MAVSKYETWRGVVLRTQDINEYDRLISFYGQDQGLVTLIAKSVRKQKAKMRSVVTPWNEVSLDLVKRSSINGALRRPP